MDVLALVGALIAFAAIIGGNYLEGGHLEALLNTPAVVIVIGGTLGAVMLQTPYPRLKRALNLVRWIVSPPRPEFPQSIARICDWSRRTRKEGLLGLENILDAEKDPFTRKGLEMIIDGGEPHVIRRALEMDLNARTESDLAAAQVFRAMGGYAPTIGILGAVLGLIHVMGNLADPSALGQGIATAFVATIYGVGFANLLFLPVADRLRAVALNLADARSLLIEGLLAIAEGEHPRTIEVRLGSYLERV